MVICSFRSWCAGRLLPLIALVMFVGCGGSSAPTGESASSADDQRPNIIYIMADDLGYGDVGVYGQKQIETPNIDQLAREGVRFTDFYAGSTVCAPARSALMTGRHTGRTYIRGNREVQPMGQEPLPDSIVTVAEVLQDAGYRTGLIGKWGLGGPDSPGIPNNQGFDYFYGYLGQRHAHNYYPEFLFRNSERVSLEGNVVDNDRLDGAGQAVERAQYSHDLMAEEALEFVERNRDSTFFLYLSFTIPHANNEAGEEGMEVPDYGQYADEDWPDPQKGLAAMISRMDRDIGDLGARLDELGIDDETIIFFTSDNGPHAEGGNDPHFFDSNGELTGIKRDLYEGGVRVPMIVRWPGNAPAGEVSDHVGYFPDFLPTAADLAGVSPPQNVDGISFLPEILGNSEQQSSHDYLYWEFYAAGSAQAVRMGRWKGVRQPMLTGDIELYDLEEDIGEQEDVSDQHPEIVTRIERAMEEAHQPSSLFQPPS